MQHDEGGPFDALLLGAFRHYLGLVPDQIWYVGSIALAALIVWILWWLLFVADLPSVIETSTDRSLSK